MLLALRKNINEAEREKKDEILFNKVTALEAYKHSDILLTYYPVKGEVNILPIVFDALKKGKRVAFPISNTDKCTLSFRYVNSLDELVIGAYSIPEPAMNALPFENKENTLCIVPALAFDSTGARIGYGKGYYDRFLSSFEGICLGVCYSEFLLDNIPIELTDRLVDIVITDKEEFFINE